MLREEKTYCPVEFRKLARGSYLWSKVSEAVFADLHGAIMQEILHLTLSGSDKGPVTVKNVKLHLHT